MIDDELKKLWQSAPNQERARFERSRLMIDVQASVDRFHQLVKYRDARELIGVALGVPVFAYFAYAVPFVLTKIASVLIIVWGVYVALRLRHTKKQKPEILAETYLGHLQKTKAYLVAQKQLLDSVLYWYILPAMALIFLFRLGFPTEPGQSGALLVLALGTIALAVAIYFLNKAAVKKEIVPRIEKVDELIKALEED